jgi:hypothetical protein
MRFKYKGGSEIGSPLERIFVLFFLRSVCRCLTLQNFAIEGAGNVAGAVPRVPARTWTPHRLGGFVITNRMIRSDAVQHY